MEDVTKESGHRPSVSMPSLDSADDFPSHTASATDNSDPVFATTDSLASTDDTPALEPSSVSASVEIPVSSTDTISTEDSQSAGELSTGTLTEEASQEESLVEEDPANSSGPLIDTTIAEALIDEASTEVLIGTQTGGSSQGSLDESQVEEDPSIAIDQFIKKIADEQLSSKRIEERQEEEAKEQREDNKDLNLEENKECTTENTKEEVGDESLPATKGVALEAEPVEEETIAQIDGDKPPEESCLENTSTENINEVSEDQLMEEEKPEPMEVDGDIHSEPTQESNIEKQKTVEKEIINLTGEEHMQMESIEEIQKEIDKIPAKTVAKSEEHSKTTESGLSNEKEDSALNGNKNGNNHVEDESIEHILGGVSEERKVGLILKSALEKQIKAPSIEDSGEVAKDHVLIEKAQEEIKKMDVLVCGECHHTFYYIQDFTDHKKGKCSQTSTLAGSCEAESKPQVWGFVLWKIKQTKDLGDDNIPSSWSIYQKWCKLPLADKNAWITAGQSIQFASKIGNAKVTEMRSSKPAKQTIVQKINIDATPPPVEFVDSNKENSSSMDLENTASNIIKKGFTKPVRLNNDVTILPSPKNASTNSEVVSNSNTAVRTTKLTSMQKDEFVVEKIMAKRFNPRKKTWEYNIKWEHFGHDSNTWEPISNLSHCKKLLEQFEEQLKRMKEEKVKQAAQSPKGRGRPANPKPIKTGTSHFVPIAPKTIATISNVVGGVSEDYAGGSGNRPQRFSKQKAMNQVKEWCGNISDDEGGTGGTGLKRRYESDDSDVDFDDKKIKLEEDSDYSDTEVKPKVSIKKVTATPTPTPKHIQTKTITVKNGNTTQQVLPSNILIPDANGVVRINQKQLPALSSGVYIMSKTAGIIKLDSTTSKVATSGGQTIVKVAPKIGQTQIKIVKKDGNTTKQIIQVSPKPTISSTPVKIAPASKNAVQRFTPKIRKEVRKPPPLTEPTSKFVAKKVDVTPPPPKKPAHDSDSDDGLEPLPFPEADEPLPELEEEPKDDGFLLDPETGKIAGVDYVDKPVVIKEEPAPMPPTTNELENIVKMAAAELSEDDLHNSDSHDDPLFTERKEVKPPVKPAIKTKQKPVQAPTPVVRKVVKYSVAASGGVRSENPPILNKTLVQAQQRPTPVPAPAKPAVQQQRRVVQQQKVINQMVSQRPPTHQARTVVRHVIEPTRPGHGGNINVIRKTVTSTPKPKFNLSPQKPLPSPLQPTRTYSAMGGIRQTNVVGQGSKVQVYSAKSSVPASQTATHVQGGAVRRIGNTVVRSTSGGQVTTMQRQSGGQVTTTQRQQQQHVQHYAPQKPPVARIVQRVVSSPKKVASTHHQIMNSTPKQIQSKQTAPAKPRTVINMPSLTEDDSPLMSSHVQQKPQPALQKAAPKVAAPIKQEPVLKVEEPAAEESAMQVEATDSGASAEQTDWSSFTMADGDNPIYVTGDDGTIYQVAGQNEQGQTILITQGADGQQQCLLVTNEIGEMAPDEPQASTSTATTADQEMVESENTSATEAQEGDLSTNMATSVEDPTTPLHIKTDTSEMEGIEDGIQDQVVAQVVRAEPPSPGGTHKVVVMLPDGNLMVTQVSPEEYASLELE